MGDAFSVPLSSLAYDILVFQLLLKFGIRPYKNISKTFFDLIMSVHNNAGKHSFPKGCAC